jgi:hypothetical protein
VISTPPYLRYSRAVVERLIGFLCFPLKYRRQSRPAPFPAQYLHDKNPLRGLHQAHRRLLDLVIRNVQQHRVAERRVRGRQNTSKLEPMFGKRFAAMRHRMSIDVHADVTLRLERSNHPPVTASEI